MQFKTFLVISMFHLSHLMCFLSIHFDGFKFSNLLHSFFAPLLKVSFLNKLSRNQFYSFSRIDYSYWNKVFFRENPIGRVVEPPKVRERNLLTLSLGKRKHSR